MGKFIIPEVVNCTRCGGQHSMIDAVPFKKQPTDIVIDGLEITHYAICPSTKDPILVSVTK